MTDEEVKKHKEGFGRILSCIIEQQLYQIANDARELIAYISRLEDEIKQLRSKNHGTTDISA